MRIPKATCPSCGTTFDTRDPREVEEKRRQAKDARARAMGDPRTRKRISQRVKALWKDPVYRARMLANLASARRRMAELRATDPTWRELDHEQRCAQQAKRWANTSPEDRKRHGDTSRRGRRTKRTTEQHPWREKDRAGVEEAQAKKRARS